MRYALLLAAVAAALAASPAFAGNGNGQDKKAPPPSAEPETTLVSGPTPIDPADVPAQGVPILRRQDAEDRLQGSEDDISVHHRAGQNDAEPDHRQLRTPPAIADDRRQKSAERGVAALHHCEKLTRFF